MVRLTTASSGAAASGWVPADEVAAVGHLECRPYAPDADGARLHLEAPDRLRLPASMPPVRLVAGEATLHLAPTGADWCWQIIERTPRGKTRYVLVPDSVATLDYADLVDVDPLTLEPTAEPEAAWWAAIETMAGGWPLPAFRPDPDDDGALLVDLWSWQIASDDPNAMLVTVEV